MNKLKAANKDLLEGLAHLTTNAELARDALDDHLRNPQNEAKASRVKKEVSLTSAVWSSPYAQAYTINSTLHAYNVCSTKFSNPGDSRANREVH